MTWFNRIIGSILVLILLLLLSLWAFSPPLSRLLINHFLEPQALSLSPESAIRFNPFASQLTVNDLALVGSEQETLVIEKFELEYRFFALFKKQLVIPKITLTGFHIDAEQRGDVLSIAGITIASEGQDEETQTSDEETTAAERSSAALIIQRVELADVSVTLREDEQTRTLTLSKLAILDTHYQQDEQGLSLEAAISLQDLHYRDSTYSAQLGSYRLFIDEIQLSDNAQSALRARTDLNALSLTQNASGETLASLAALKIDDISLQRGEHALTFDLPTIVSGKLALNLPDKSMRINVDSIQFQDSYYGYSTGTEASARTNVIVEKVQFADSSHLATLEHASVSLNHLKHPTNDTSFEKLDAQLAIALTNFAAKLEQTGDTIASFSGFNIDTAQVKRDGDNLSYAIPKISTANVIASEKSTQKYAPLLSLDALQIERLTGSETHLDIDSILIGKLASFSKLEETGLANLVLPAPTSSSTESTESATPSSEPPLENAEKTGNSEPATEPEFTFAIKRISTTDKAVFDLVDETKKKTLKKQLTINELIVSNINSKDSEETMRFSASVQDENYMQLSIDGQAQPFKEQLNAQVESKLKEFSLPQVNKYVADTLGFEFKSGELDTQLSGKIVDSEIDMDVILTLRGSDFSASQHPEDEINLVGQSAVPLNVALSMLKDKRGNIKLNVPVTGNINDPEFGFHYLLALIAKKAVMRQTKNYLMTTFVPYAQVVNVALAAGSYALKVRFEDLVYEPGQIELNENQNDFVDQLTSLMKDKPKLSIKVCPVTSVSESSDESVVGDERRRELLALAEERAAHFKSVVVERGIESSRLLLCRAKIESSDSHEPRLRFSI